MGDFDLFSGWPTLLGGDEPGVRPGGGRAPGSQLYEPANGLTHPGSPFARMADAVNEELAQLQVELEQQLQQLVGERRFEILVQLTQDAFGPQAFGLGVCFGLVSQPAKDILGVVDLARVFVLADFYDQLYGPITPVTLIGPKSGLLAAGRAAIHIFGDNAWLHHELASAFQERELIIAEVKKVAADPIAFVAGIPGAIVGEYKQKWARFEKLRARRELQSQFEAGQIFGELLIELILTVLSVLALAGALAKLVSKAPALLRWIRRVTKIAPASEVGGTAEAAEALGGPKPGPRPSGPKPGPEPAPEPAPKPAPEPAPKPAPEPAPKPVEEPKKPAEEPKKPPREKAEPLKKGPPNPDATARGTPETAPRAPKRKQEDLARQNDSADMLAKEGYDVEHNQEVKPNGKVPDYKVNGEYVDHFNARSSNPDSVRNTISDKVPAQADRLAVRLDDTTLSAEDVQGVLERKPVTGLKEVIFIKDGVVTSYVP